MVTSFANIFSPSVGCLFILFIVSFVMQKFFSRSHLFVFIPIILGDGLRKILLQFVSECSAYVFLYKFYGITFRPLIHFEFIFVYGVRICSNFILLHVAAYFPQNHLLRDCLFTTVYSCLLCRRLIYQRCVGLFLGFLSCSIDLYFCFCASTVFTVLITIGL